MPTSTNSLQVQVPRRFTGLLVNVFFIAIILFLFRDILFDTRIVTGFGGDGTKNLYTFLYHILYEKGCWFYGMNYPYGEHVVFTDNQPLFSVTLSYLNSWLHFSIPALIGFIYWGIAFSFWLGMQFTFRILLHFRMQYLLAMVCSACIIMLSPQVFRIVGHFPLAFSSFLPMLFFWTIRYNETDKKRYLVYLSVLGIVYAFLHMYFLAMSLVWTAGYFIAFWLSRNDQVKNKWRHTLLFVLNNVVTIGVLEIFLWVTDPVKDRPLIPYSSEPDGIFKTLFTARRSPFWQGIKNAGIVDAINETTEGAAYSGLAMMIMMVAGIIIWGRWRLKHKQGFQIAFPSVWILLALVTVVFAMGVDHVWNMALLRQILRPFKQFRVPERFSWIFYYVMSVYTAVALDAVCKKLYSGSKRVLSIALAVIILGAWIVEGVSGLNVIHRQSINWKGDYKTFFLKPGHNWSSFLAQHNFKNTDFTAIALVPHVHIGSEKVWINEDYKFPLSFVFGTSLETKLPIMDVMMSRSSWSQTFEQVKFSAGLLAEQTVLEQMKDDRILLMQYKEYPINPDEQEVINASEYIGEFQSMHVYAFYPKRLLKKRITLCDSLGRVASVMQGTDTVLGYKDQCLIAHFEQQNAPYVFAGTGAMPAIVTADSVVTSWNIPPAADSVQYEFSGWARFTGDGAGYCNFVMIFRDAKGNELDRINAVGGNSVDNDPELWFRINRFFKMPVNARTVEIRVSHNGEKSYFALDELLLRPVTTTVLSKMKDGTVLANNHVLVKGSDRK